MAAYTPGPWRVDALDDGLGLVTLSDGAEVGTERRGEFTYLRIEDARLIAAAPELLAALKTLVMNLSEWDTTAEVEKLWGGELAALIAKAEGR